MKNIFNKKIVAGILIFFIFITASFSAYPKKAQAILGVGDIVSDIVTEVQSILSVIGTYASEALSYSDNYKEYVLDPLVSMVAKQMLRAMTGSIVNWINSGFQGSPSFMQNPGSFFLDVADQITGEWLATKGGALVNLCSPFSLDIRLALSIKFHTNPGAKYACTLGTIIKNAKNAKVNVSTNLSVTTEENAFMGGDFSKGGWPAFAALTIEPQNNIYGAYLNAESDLSYQVSTEKDRRQNEINSGHGFMSWRDPKCLNDIQKYNNNLPVSSNEDEAIANYNDGSLKAQRKDPNSCPIKTPGATISAALDVQLGSPTRQLELADEIGEIMNALFSQLATQVLQRGLASVSEKGSSGTSYIDVVTTSGEEDSTQVNSIRTEILKNLDKEIAITARYKTQVEATYKIVTDIKTNYDSAKACYLVKLSGQPPLTTVQADYAQSRINDINLEIGSSTFATTYNTVTLNYQNANTKYNSLVTLKTNTTNAKTLTEINADADEFGRLIRDLTTEVDIQTALDETLLVESKTKDSANKASNLVQQCQGFPANLP